MRKCCVFALFAILLSACASPQKKVSQALETSGSWSAASAMCLDAYRNGSVTRPFAKKFLDDAQKELAKAVESARKSGASSDDARLIQHTAVLISDAKAAVESRDNAKSGETSQKLRSLSSMLSTRSKDAEKSP